MPSFAWINATAFLASEPPEQVAVLVVELKPQVVTAPPLGLTAVMVAPCGWSVTWIWFSVFFFNDTATTEIYTLSLHDALPISVLVIARSATARTVVVTVAEVLLARFESNC